jgi:dipeptidyl aminopeptidase/acylaminoacyl peptidase
MLEDGGLRQITHHNDPRFADIELVDGIPIWYPARDGHRIQAWVYQPADFDPALAYPLVIDLHGGSIMQVGYRFEGMAQLLAANGYVVMVPNYRGSSGYGRDHQLANWQRLYNGSDFEDVVDGASHMASLPYIDGDRMAVQGWSYGGGLTTKLITAEPELFAAAISGAGNSYRYGEYGSDIYQAALEKVIGLPWENRAMWQQGSPFDDVAKAVTPTMFVSGEKDWNVPVTNSERMYQAMKRLGRETLLVVYPGQPHVILVPRYEQHRLEMYLDWYRKYLR